MTTHKQLPDFATDPDDSDEVASLWDHGFKRGWNSCLGAVAKTMQPTELQPISHDWDDQDKCRRCGDRDWYAGPICTPKQPVPDMPGLTEALRQYRHNDGSGLVFGYDRLLVDQYVTQLVEALEAFIAYHRHDSSDGVGEMLAYAKALDLSLSALAAHRNQGDDQ